MAESVRTLSEEEKEKLARDVNLVSESVRTLSEKEKEKLARDVNLVSEFKSNKFEKEAQKNWDVFYKRNTTKFFKDRHWTRREFGELINSSDEEGLVLFEVGCGVGNFMFPLMLEDKNMYVYACDFSHRAVQFVKENPGYDTSRCTVFQCDIVNDDLTNQVPDEAVDVATMIFVLSAIHPDKMAPALQKILQTLKPGGCLLVRDYGLYDYAMLRFAPGHKLSENFYVRQDGTRAYYFSLGRNVEKSGHRGRNFNQELGKASSLVEIPIMEVLDTLMRSSGFEVSRSEYIHRQTVNKKEGLEVPRTFVQGKYVKPTGSSLLSTQSTGNEAARDKMAQTLENETTGTSLQSTQSTRIEAARDNMAQTLENETTGTSLQSTQSTGNEAARDNMAQTLENETNGTSLQSTKSTGNEAARDNMAQTLENETNGTSLQSTKSTGNEAARDNMAQTLENETTGTSLQSTKSAGNKVASDKIATTNFENKTTDQEITQSAEKEIMKGEMTQTHENETSRDECIDCDRLREVEKSCKNTGGKKNCGAEVPDNMYANGDNASIAEETCICSEDKNNVTKDGDSLREFDKCVQENFEIPIHEHVKPKNSEAEILCEKYETDDISKISSLSIKNNCDLNERKVASGCDSMQDDS